MRTKNLIWIWILVLLDAALMVLAALMTVTAVVKLHAGDDRNTYGIIMRVMFACLGPLYFYANARDLVRDVRQLSAEYPRVR